MFFVYPDKAAAILQTHAVNAVFSGRNIVAFFVGLIKNCYFAFVLNQRAVLLKGRVGNADDETSFWFDEMRKSKIQTAEIKVVEMNRQLLEGK